MKRFWLGLDVGSISVNTILLDEDRAVVEERYTLCHGRPFQALRTVLDELAQTYPVDSIRAVALTGTGGAFAAGLIGGCYVNEIVAQSSAAAALYPEARTVIEMGGEDSKLIIMEAEPGAERPRLADFVMNTVCAAGTGSFLDQQASRIGVSIQDEFGELALKSADPPRIAGRCSVFAKSDMIHLQQIATPVHDIVAGLCFAVARNFKSNLAKNRELVRPVLFQGGVAANAGVVRAFREVLGLANGELIIPTHYASMGAIGAVLHAIERPPALPATYFGTDQLAAYLAAPGNGHRGFEPLARPGSTGHKEVVRLPGGADGPVTSVALGIDVGSLSTNVVLIDDGNHIVARRYLPTASKPLDAIRRGLEEISDEVGDRVVVTAVGATGSGRYLTGDFVGADAIQNEITAQAAAAIAIDPEVDTIFEIGGQDSKFISIDNGVVVDFEMNKVCAAGTGSFLEEQAEKLDVSIVGEFGELAFAAKKPSRLGDRCTVFMESDLNSHQQKGSLKDDLLGGLAYSIVLNYIQKVVGAKRIGERILFQGGVANNEAVVSAFAQMTGKHITVPPHFDVTGAIGAAMLAREKVGSAGRTAFKGFSVSRTPYEISRFTCHSCENECDVRKVTIKGERRSLYYGDRCDRYQPAGRRTGGEGIPNLFDRRLALLMGDFDDRQGPVERTAGRTVIGIPRSLMAFYQQFPFWRTVFEQLGFDVVLSRPSDRPLVTKALGMLAAETCFPVEVIHGHIDDLLSRGVDYVFTPFVVDNEADEKNPTSSYNCPWIQSYPFMIKGAMKGTLDEERLLIPTVHFRYSRKLVVENLSVYLSPRLDVTPDAVASAVDAGFAAQREFEQSLAREGEQVLAALPEGKTPLVVLGRPYNTCDPELNLGLVKKLIKHDVLPIPLDFLPLDLETLYRDYPTMYWPNGQKIIAGARFVAADDRLHAVYLTNFRCGPDSFIMHYIREEMRGKPYLLLEVDEHSADAGMMTRCEAFLDSLKAGAKASEPVVTDRPAVAQYTEKPLRGRTLYFPYMNDGALLLAAACRGCGMDARVLPPQNDRDLELGRKHTSSRECFPMICTTGSILRALEDTRVDPARSAFFMPSHGGPCRFGQYHTLQRILLERLGHGDTQIVSPSNKDSYGGFYPGLAGIRFRMLMWKALLSIDILERLRQEKRPYERIPGRTQEVYEHYLAEAERSIERGARNLKDVLHRAGREFSDIPVDSASIKPVIAIVGEIFMRDNPFCSGFLQRRLEDLGVETIMAPVHEWISLASLRSVEESSWRGDLRGRLKGKLQHFIQSRISASMFGALNGELNHDHDVPVDEILDLCGPYIHRDYVGDPPLALGAAAALAKTGIAGVANILPFTCLPGTIVASISSAFRKDHQDIPWVDIAYDGQADTGIETRLQAFVHQATEYADAHGLLKARR